MPRRLIERWRISGETKRVEWKHVRLALMLGGFCLAVTMVGFVTWVADTQDDAQATAYTTALNEWKRCTDRAESGGQIADVNTAAVDHAEETADAVAATARTFDEMVAVFENAGSGSERLTLIRQLVDDYAHVAAEYQAGVDVYRAAAEAYVPQDPDACPPKPIRD